MTENEKLEAFDKWYDENYDEWAEVEEGIALREELEQAFKGGIAELEKENAELKEKLKEELKTIADKDLSFVARFDALEKENAELKSENQKWKDEWQEKVQEATDEGYARTLQTIQLTKAKEIIKELMSFSVQLCDCRHTVDFEKTREEAEQFLNSEVEK